MQSKSKKNLQFIDNLIEIAYAVHRHKQFKMIVFHSKANKNFAKKAFTCLSMASTQHSQGNTCVGVFFIKILLKRDSNKGVLL